MDLASLTPLNGGWSGETFVGEVSGERVVVRIYGSPRSLARGDAAPEVDAAVLRLVRGLLPVPEVLEVRRGDPAQGRPGLLVTSYADGTRGDLVLPTLDDAGLRRAGESVGAVVAALGAMPMLRAGAFVDADLGLGDLGDLGDGGLTAWAEGHLSSWADADREGLLAVCAEAEALLDTVTRRCLVHSDLNPKNLLLDPATGEVAAVLDWEFAHAGHPFTDLGNALRFDREPAYVSGVLDAYDGRHRVPPGSALTLARAADLWALIDLAGRAGEHPVADRASRLLREIARSRDVHAVPEDDREE